MVPLPSLWLHQGWGAPGSEPFLWKIWDSSVVIPAKQWSLPRGVTGAGWMPGFPELGEGCLLLQQHWDLYFRSLNVDFWGCFPSKSIPWKPSTEHPTRCGCSEPNSESQTPNPSPQGLNGNFQVVFSAFTCHLCLSSSSFSCALMERQRCLLELPPTPIFLWSLFPVLTWTLCLSPLRVKWR